MIFHTPQKIKEHLFFYGSDQSYHTSYWNGEATPSCEPSTIRATCFNRIEIDNVDYTIEMVEAAEDDYKANP